jgi:hypothetical protein
VTQPAPPLGPDEAAAIVLLEAVLAGLRSGEVRVWKQSSTQEGDGGTIKVSWLFRDPAQTQLGDPLPVPPADPARCADCNCKTEEDADGWTCPRCLKTTPRAG